MATYVNRVSKRNAIMRVHKHKPRKENAKKNSELPFELDRGSGFGLVEQAVAGMKSAIVSEFYQIGDRVLSLSEFARRYGTSLKVPRMAYAQLVSGGWLKARHGVGFIAASPDVRVWKGRVLYVQYGMGFSQSVLSVNMQRMLVEAGYRVISVALSDASRQSLESLEAALEDKFDIVFAICPRAEFEALLEKSGMPYVVTHGGFVAPEKPGPNCRGVIVDGGTVLRDMVAAVRKAGVRTAACVDACGRSVYDCIAEALKGVGIDVEQWRTPIVTSFPDGQADGFRRGAERYFAERLNSGASLPELLVFIDDYIAEGALYAMARAGVEVPNDVKVITLYNKGFGLTCPLDFTRMEVDFEATARAYTAFLIACIAGRRAKVPRNVIRFVPGSTL